MAVTSGCFNEKGDYAAHFLQHLLMEGEIGNRHKFAATVTGGHGVVRTGGLAAATSTNTCDRDAVGNACDLLFAF